MKISVCILACVAMSALMPTGLLGSSLYEFSLLPGGGVISGPPGATIGWGFTLTNNDPLRWLVPSALNVDGFANGTPLDLFEFPILAPLTTLSVAFDGARGLYQLTWPSNAVDGAVDAGNFVLSADWYDSDPLAGGVFLENAGDITAAYAAVATDVPEPSSWTLALLGLGAMFTYRKVFECGRARPFRWQTDLVLCCWFRFACCSQGVFRRLPCKWPTRPRMHRRICTFACLGMAWVIVPSPMAALPAPASAPVTGLEPQNPLISTGLFSRFSSPRGFTPRGDENFAIPTVRKFFIARAFNRFRRNLTPPHLTHQVQ